MPSVAKDPKGIAVRSTQSAGAHDDETGLGGAAEADLRCRKPLFREFRRTELLTLQLLGDVRIGGQNFSDRLGQGHRVLKSAFLRAEGPLFVSGDMGILLGDGWETRGTENEEERGCEP